MSHHLFTSVSYCWYTATLCQHCFLPDAPRLPADYYKALSQPVKVGTPLSHAPLHILCNGSDAQLATKDIMQSLIEMNIVQLDAFATLKDAKVSVLVFIEKFREIMKKSTEIFISFTNH